ncbi:glycosyltransferase family 2 protein [Escherichia coli]|uniref:glycosyltransferase family 2 protein n=1 Tax=Escherichia coli TaxID=562 RepID=UPI003CF23030
MISLIVPYFNKSASFKKTLSSISIALNHCDATTLNYEIIIVNDGSCDNERNKLFHLSKKYESLNLKIYNKKNGGVSNARNFGIDKSIYPFVYFLDADDKLDKNFFNIFLNNCINIFSHHMFDLKINNKIIHHNLSNNTVVLEQDLFTNLFTKKCLHLSNFIFLKRDIINFNEKIKVGEDLLFIYESTIGQTVSPHNHFIAKYNYDGKFHITENNGISLILEKISDKKTRFLLEKLLNERFYLTNCFAKTKIPYNSNYISKKIRLLGFFRSKSLYAIIQKIRFLMP